MYFKELYLRSKKENIIEFIKRITDENGYVIKIYSENHLRIYSSSKGLFKDALKVLLWKGGRRYPPNYPLIDIILLTPYKDITQVIIGFKEATSDIGELYCNELLRKYMPYQPWIEFKKLSTP
ncbi:MAG TPA: hypothetical protein ENF47_05865 [Thermoprotei archaeon]|nr:hypothetical protein [Thermoprotei archaeon]